MRPLLALLLVLALIAVPATAERGTVRGVAWDESQWTGILLPEMSFVGSLASSPDSVVVFPLPPGTLLLLPVPEEFD